MRQNRPDIDCSWDKDSGWLPHLSKTIYFTEQK